MKIVVVWVCLLTKASAFPTGPPPDAEEKKPCCVGPPRLLFKGFDSKHGINVYLFEFLPLKNGSKSIVKDENVEHSHTTSEGKENPLSNTEDGNQHERAVPETNTPAYPHGSNVIPNIVNHFTNISLNTVGAKERDSIFPGTSMNLSPANISQHKTDLETNSGPRTVAQNDTEKYIKVKKNDITVGDEAKNTDVGIINGHNDVDGYYSSGGIILTDISGYSDTKATKQDPNVSFPSKDVENSNTLDCSDGLCRNTSEYIENSQHTHSKSHTEMHYPAGKSFELKTNVTQSSKNHTNKPSGRHKKPVTHKEKANKQPDQPIITNKQSQTVYSTNRNAKHSSKQRGRYAHHHSSHNHYHHHHKQSSSESTSDSSQQFG